jgi:hypothetical protein
VPARFKTKSGYSLGHWISKVRKNKNILSKEIIRELEKYPDWIWGSPLDVKWETAFQELEAYAKKIGDTFIHIDYKTKSGFNLGIWVSHQRRDFKTKKDRMNEYRIKKLQSIPTWTWQNDAYEQNWIAMYELLERHVEEKGFIPPKSYIDKNGIKLGNWVTNQRSYRSKSKLSQDKIEKLNNIRNWKWKF